MTRRGLLLSLLAGSIGSAWKGKESAAQLSSMKEVETLQKNWQALLADGVTVPLPTEKLKLSKEEWRKRLQPNQFNILREEGTEPPGSSPLNHEKRDGTFVCAGCGQPLFSADTKYESGSGWPSFFKPLDSSVETTTDRSHGMTRVEVHCRNCGGHLGHVFPDGPQPTGERYCMNGAALTFDPEKKP